MKSAPVQAETNPHFLRLIFSGCTAVMRKNKAGKPSILNSNRTPIGGFKEIIASIEGKDVFGNLKYESGVHRVQSIPETEKSGRIHTSTATVAVLPEAEEVEIEINPE